MEQVILKAVLVYLLVMSLAGYAIMGVDKQKARRGHYRIPERTLLLIAFLGGGIGSTFGMLTFRHKTKHIKFAFFLPFTAFLYLIIGMKILCLLWY